MKKLSSLVLAIVAVFMLAGAPTAQEPAVLTAAVGNNMNHVPSFVGVEKGIFLKHGVDLKLKVLGTGQEMAKALQAGEVQIIGSAYSNYPLAVERGMAARGVVGLMGDRSGRYWDQSVTIWTRKGTGITKIEDLAGRKLGTPVGGTADEYLGVVLKKKGVPYEKVQVLNVPPGQHPVGAPGRQRRRGRLLGAVRLADRGQGPGRGAPEPRRRPHRLLHQHGRP